MTDYKAGNQICRAAPDIEELFFREKKRVDWM